MVALAAERVGVAITVTVLEMLDVQLPLAPTIVYTVVVGGPSVCIDPVNAPGFHVYDVAPLAVNTVELPEQIVALLAVIVGVAFTVTVLEILEVQLPLAPTIV